MTKKEIKIQLALGTLSFDDKLRLATSKKTPKEILSMLSTDEAWAIRSHIAYNPNTPKEVLNKLSTDNSWFVKSSVAFNSNTPKEILIGLGIF